VVKSANRSRHRLTSVAAFSFPKTPVMARPVLLWSFSSVFPLKVHYTEFVPSAEVSTSLLLPTETPPVISGGVSSLLELQVRQERRSVLIVRSVLQHFSGLSGFRARPTERNNDRCPQ
jgi:hypothetical protein